MLAAICFVHLGGVRQHNDDTFDQLEQGGVGLCFDEGVEGLDGHRLGAAKGGRHQVSPASSRLAAPGPRVMRVSAGVRPLGLKP